MSLQRVMAAVFAFLTASSGAAAVLAANIDIQVKLSEPVTVTGTPALGLDVGGQTRTATYQSGSGTDMLTFRYPVQSGDFDPDGIGVTGFSLPQGSSIADAAGNGVPPSFPTANFATAKVKTYGAAWVSTQITGSNAASASFRVLAPLAGVSYTYAVSSSADPSLSVTGSGTTAAEGWSSSITADVSSLRPGTLTLTVTFAPAGGSVIRNATVPASGIASGSLDTLSPSVAAAYSVRLLLAAYTGPLMQVRRSSDATTADIYPTIAGNLDQLGLTRFCGTGDCFVAKWYDQSSPAADVVQATAALQPRIVAAGVIDKLNARPSPRGVNQNLLAGPAPMANSAELTVSMVARPANLTTNTIGWSLAPDPGRIQSHAPWSDGRIYFDLGAATGASRISSNPNPVASGAAFVATFVASVQGSLQQIYANGALAASDASGGTVTVSRVQILGIEGTTNYTIPGPTPEYVFFSSALSATTRKAWEQNQGAYYGITVP